MKPLIVAAAQPRTVARDVAVNARAHAEAVRAARARVVVFPELSLTGYELDADPVLPDDAVLAPIVDACATAGSVAFVGVPLPEHIATLRVHGDGAEVAYRKAWLGDDERRRFSPGPGPVAVEVDGRRIGLGICKDTGVPAHVEAVAALGVDLYLAGLVHGAHERDELEARGVRIARATGSAVAFASFAGPTGGGYDRTAGGSAIWSATGEALARAGDAPGEVVRATLA